MNISLKIYYLVFFYTIAASDGLIAQTISTVAGGNGMGTAADQFNAPQGICLDAFGNIYVADQGNNRVLRFPAGSNDTTLGQVVAGGNGSGNAHNQLDLPGAVFVDDSGYLYVSDSYNNRVLRFPPGSNSGTDGSIVAGGNGQGDSADQFWHTGGIFVDHSGNLFVADQSNYRVQEFPAGSDSLTAGTTVAGGNGMGHAANQFTSPQYLYVDDSGYLYVSDFINARIMRFPPGSDSTTAGVILVSGGSGPDSLMHPTGIFVDSTGSIYVADWGNGRVQKFSAAGLNGTTVVGGYGSGIRMYQLSAPEGVCVDRSGSIYISDSENNRVQKWTQYGLGITCAVTVSGITCFGDSNGSIRISASGGAAPYQYSLNGGPAQDTGYFTGLPPAAYTILLTDSLGNVRVLMDTLTGPDSALVVTDSLGYATGDSSITLTVRGGAAPYSFRWSNGDSTQMATGLGPGRYFVTVTDARGCSVYDTIRIAAAGINDISADEDFAIYPNPNNGAFILSSNNAIGETYIIRDMLGRTIASQVISSDIQNVFLRSIASGSYSLSVKGCVKQLVIDK